MRHLAVMLLLCVAATSVQAQDAADYTYDGITYYLAAGTHQSGHMARGPSYDGTVEDFQGCAHIYVHDRPVKNDVGIMQVIAKYGDEHLAFYFTDFQGTIPEMDGGLAQDIFVDGSHMVPGQIQHPAVFAGMAGWGTAMLQIGPNLYPDPVTGSGILQAYMFVTPNGFRDNATGAVLDDAGGIWEPGERALVGQDDWEVHLRVKSEAGSSQPDLVQVVREPATPTGYFDANTAYSQSFLFDNQRFGGTATIEIEAEALALAEENVLRFTFRDPRGDTLDEIVLEPDAMNPATHTAEVPLNKFGKYSMQVSGTVKLSKYELRLIQHTPPEFDLHMWWDETRFEGESTQALWDCQEEVGRPEEMVATIIDRVEPPPFDWVPIGVGLAAAVLGILVAGRLVHLSATRVRD